MNESGAGFQKAIEEWTVAGRPTAPWRVTVSHGYLMMTTAVGEAAFRAIAVSRFYAAATLVRAVTF